MVNLINGDCLTELRKIKYNTIDSLVTDPPAGIGFMGKEWDKDKGGRDSWIAWMTEVMSEALRVLKPGAHGFVWALPRTSGWTCMALENAGFEIRDVVTHLFGSGFPKSHNISKAIDKKFGAERVEIKTGKTTPDIRNNNYSNSQDKVRLEETITKPSTDQAKQWDGWGTALKPASEHWILVRKPLSEKNIVDNLLKWGVGGINIDDCRIETDDKLSCHQNKGNAYSHSYKENGTKPEALPSHTGHSQGRFPANLVLSHHPECKEVCSEDCPIKLLDEQSGILKGGASRFFYCAKASKYERNKGLDSVLQIRYKTELCKEENTVLVQLLQKVISGLTVKWNIDESGKNITAQCQKDCLSTILTEINKIIESKTLNYLHHLNTNDCTQDVKELKVSGSSLVANAEKLNQWLHNITKEKTVSVLGVVNAAKKTLQKIKEKDEWQSLTNIHSTVKPQKLMQYLIKMVTPPNGIVLDPFMGSGSTGVVCKTLGFNFIGIEKDLEYFQIASKRINNG